MLTRALGIDIEAVFMTMLGLVALYLVLTRAAALNQIIRTTLGGANTSLVILQGRNPRTVLAR